MLSIKILYEGTKQESTFDRSYHYLLKKPYNVHTNNINF